MAVVNTPSRCAARGDAEKLRHRITNPLPVVVQEEKCLVLRDGAAQCAAELILLERCRLIRRSKEVPRVEDIVPQEIRVRSRGSCSFRTA